MLDESGRRGRPKEKRADVTRSGVGRGGGVKTDGVRRTGHVRVEIYSRTRAANLGRSREQVRRHVRVLTKTKS